MLEHKTWALIAQHAGQTAEASAGVATAQAVTGIRCKATVMHVISDPTMPARNIGPDFHTEPNFCLPVAGRIEVQDPLPHALDPAGDGRCLDIEYRGGVRDWPLLR
ncbi:hypothetical protein A6U89_33100 [Agrobacterium sp. B133/95]|nr:hypothetical protein A6U88_33365 [Agrobacterium sp. B131/95]OCJ22223.1 hypothetical protein A6U89_33100 [Agrobacterium sp. B133/95]